MTTQLSKMSGNARDRLAGSASVLALVMAALSTAASAAEWNEVPLTPGTYREYPATHRTDTIDIRVPANGGELEYMLKMKMGDSIVYTWAPADAASSGALTSEFHGHTEPPAGMPGTLIFYRKAMGARESGSLVAPFEGIHGWYLKNDNDKPVVVRLMVSGFYELIPNQLRN